MTLAQIPHTFSDTHDVSPPFQVIILPRGWRSRLGLSAAVLLPKENQSFQIASKVRSISFLKVLPQKPRCLIRNPDDLVRRLAVVFEIEFGQPSVQSLKGLRSARPSGRLASATRLTVMLTRGV